MAQSWIFFFAQVSMTRVLFTLALRPLLRSRRFLAVAVVTAAAAVLPLLAILTLASAVVFKPLPFPDSERLVLVRAHRLGISVLDWNDVRERARIFTETALFAQADILIEQEGNIERVAAGLLTPELFHLLDCHLLIGRATTERGKQDGVVLTEQFWRTRFGGRLDVLGQTIRIDGIRNGVVIGVLSDRIRLFPLVFRVEPPFYLFADETDSLRDNRIFIGLGRLRDGVSVRDARGTVAKVFAELKVGQPRDYGDLEPSVVPLVDEVEGVWRQAGFGAIGAATLLALSMCANLAGLLLIRTVSRMRGFGIRYAIGAPLGRIRFELMVEGIAIAALGAGLASVAAAAILRLLPWTGVRLLQIPRLEEATWGLEAFAFVFAVGAGIGVLAGAIPALAFGEETIRSGLGLHGSTLRANPFALLSILVVAQVGLASVLLLGAASLASNYASLAQKTVGYQYRGTATVRLTLPYFLTPEKTASLANEVLGRIRSMPSVASASTTYSSPGEPDFVRKFKVVAPAWLQAQIPPSSKARMQRVSSDYFATMGIRLIEGRFFDSSHNYEDRVAVVNQTLARTVFGKSALQAEIAFPQYWSRTFKVIGVVDDTLESVSSAPQPVVYLSAPNNWLYLLVKSAREPVAPAALVNLVKQTDKAIAVDQIGYLEDRVGLPLVRSRLQAASITLFGITALCIVSMGIYAMVSLAVNLRAKEIGIRMALGASPNVIGRMILRFVLLRVSLGLAFGIGLTFLLARVLRTQVETLRTNTPGETGIVATCILVAAMAATWLPLRRATGVDPATLVRDL